MFITHCPTVTLKLHNFDVFGTCRTSSFPQQPFLFLLQDLLHAFPRLFTVTSEPICLYFLVFLFYTF